MTDSNSIVVTGASTGIGYDVCKSLISRGYEVYGSVRKTEDAQRIQAELGPKFNALIFDVTDLKSIEDAAKLLAEKVDSSGIKALINNAGIAVGGPLLHIDIEKIRYQFEVNVIGLIKCIQVFAPLLGARENHPSKPGRIINISSVGGKVAMPFVAPYVGTKHALEGISESLRRELLLYGIDVVVIGPGAVKTPIWEKSIHMEAYYNTRYGETLKRFNNTLVKRSIAAGFSSEYLGEFVANVVEKTKPKTRYAVVSQWLTNWILPRLLPPRMLDKFVAKAMKIKKR